MSGSNEKKDHKTADISLILKDLLKVIKVVSMYPEDNPLPQSLKRSFAEKLESIIEQYGGVRIEVQRDCLLHQGEVIFRDSSREENLAAIFYETGIIEFTFMEGLGVEEIYTLLDTIKDYLNSPGKNQDLAAMIWEAGISRFALRTLEDKALSEYDDSFDIRVYQTGGGSAGKAKSLFGTEVQESYDAIFVGAGVNTDELAEATLEDSSLNIDSDKQSGPRPAGGVSADRSLFYAAAPGQSPDSGFAGDKAGDDLLRTAAAAAAMGFDDLPAKTTPVADAAMIVNDEVRLSIEEEEHIRVLVEQDEQFDAYESTLELLKELLLQETEMESFYETVTTCEKVTSEFIQAARLADAGSLLEFFTELEARLRPDKPLWAERLKDARITAGSRERLRVLEQSLNDNPLNSSVELKCYLENFGWEALEAITDLLNRVECQSHREALVEYLSERGRSNIDIVAKNIYDKRAETVRNAITILAYIGNDRALHHLAKVADHHDDSVRLQLLTAIRDCPDDTALAILKQAVSDGNSEIRREAVNSIVARRGQSAFDAIIDIINDDAFATFDQSDQRALLNAYSVLGGDQSVTYLSKLALAHNPFRNKSLTFLRQAAFEALSLNRSEKCEKLLVKLSGNWRQDVKRQAQAALRRRREMIFGGQ